MKGSTVAAAAAILLGAGVEAYEVLPRSDGTTPKVLHMPIHRRQHSRPVMSNALRKRNTVSETLQNFENGALYFANVTMGTPPQSFSFHIDTGSSDLWTNVKGSTLCQNDAQTAQSGGVPCSVSGTYDNTTSSTYQYINSDFKIQYADGTGASGDFVSDVVRFGSITIQNQEFGMGVQSTSAEGVMGIGFPSLESAVQTAHLSTYKNIPQQMVAQNLINTAAYSLWLDDLFSSTGNILFGGVDTDKFVGSLKKLPISRVEGEDLEMVVTLNGVTLNDGGSTSNILSQNLQVLLDSGSTMSYLPTASANKLYEEVGATMNAQQGLAFCPCSLANSSKTLNFNFDGQNIKVAMNELVIPGGTGTLDGPTGCTFGVVAQSASGGGQTSYTLGDSFIRNAYIVYDLSGSTISLAQSNFNSQTSNIQELSPSNDGSGATGVAADQANGNAATSVSPWPMAMLTAFLGGVTLLSASFM